MVLPLITESYREQNRQLHRQHQHYGSENARHLEKVLELCKFAGAETVLDYGCGKGVLVKALRERGVDVTGYDPAVDEYSVLPEPADLVICTDVLEHIEPEYVEAVLDDLARLTKRAIFLLVSTEPAKKILSDGRNAHLSIRHSNIWLNDLAKRFLVWSFKCGRGGFTAVLHK